VGKGRSPSSFLIGYEFFAAKIQNIFFQLVCCLDFLRHKKFRSLEENVVLKKPLLKSPKKNPSSNPPKRGRKKSVISGFERKWPLMRR